MCVAEEACFRLDRNLQTNVKSLADEMNPDTCSMNVVKGLKTNRKELTIRLMMSFSGA